MRKSALPLTALLIAMLAGCATGPQHEFDQQANFSELRTFAWLEPKYGDRDVSVSDPVLDSPLLGQRVRQAVVRELQERGYVQVEENPDFFVTYHTAEREEERPGSGAYMSLGYGHGYGYYGHSPYYGSSVVLDLTPRSFLEGTLIIDIVNARSDELVWRGWNDSVLNQRSFDQQRVNESVDYILTAFPPGNDDT